MDEMYPDEGRSVVVVVVGVGHGAFSFLANVSTLKQNSSVSLKSGAGGVLAHSGFSPTAIAIPRFRCSSI